MPRDVVAAIWRCAQKYARETLTMSCRQRRRAERMQNMRGQGARYMLQRAVEVIAIQARDDVTPAAATRAAGALR